MLLVMLGKKKSLVGTLEAHEIQAAAVLSGRINLMQHLGPDLMPPSRPMRTDDEMPVQEPETTHVSVAHPSASETIPSDVPVASVEPENSVQTSPTRRILFKRPPNPLDRVEPPKRTRSDGDDHSAFLTAYHRDLEKVSENLERWDAGQCMEHHQCLRLLLKINLMQNYSDVRKQPTAVYCHRRGV